MVARLLDHDSDLAEDEADGLALGICHAHHRRVAEYAAAAAREAGGAAVS